MTNYPVGDFLIKVKNTVLGGGKSLSVKTDKRILAIAESLKKLGYFDTLKKEKDVLTVTLTFKDKEPVISGLKLVSKPGLRIYMGAKEIEAKRGPSIYLISTPKGIISSREAKKLRVGGEVIAEIY